MTAAAYKLATSTWDNREIEAMQAVMATGNYTMGEKVRAFEEAYARWNGSKYAVMCNSGSSANLITVGSLFYRKDNPLQPGDECIVPAVSWSTTFFPLHQYGLKQVFVDIDGGTLNMDLDQVEAAITPKTKLIFAVNLLGNPVDYQRLEAILEKHPRITLIEDNCESMGASVGGRKTGTFGVIGTHSSFFSHHIATMEGGICVTDDEELYHILLCLRAHGWLRNLPEKNHVCDKVGDPFLDSFRFALPGYCVRPTELQGATGLVQVQKLDRFIQLRRDNAAAFRKRFGHRADIRLQAETGQSSWFGFSMVINPGAPYTRAQMVKCLQARNIECRPIVTGDFTKNPVIKLINHRIHGILKNADDIHNNGVFVGNNPEDLSACFDLLEQAFADLDAQVSKAA